MKMKLLLISLAALMALPISSMAQLQISELLFQPFSGEAEYIELYNPTDSMLELADFTVVRWVGDTMGKHYPLPLHQIPPFSYVVLSKNIASVQAIYQVPHVEHLVECQLPTYPNDGGRVILLDSADNLVDMLIYSPSMHSRLLRNKAGVSLERRRFDRPTNDPNNWFSASSLSGYGTPTEANSQSMEFVSEEVAFVVQSETFSPDGEGENDCFEVNYQLSDSDVLARVAVYDREGRQVRLLLNNGLLGTHGVLRWDGTDASGNLMPVGRYLVDIQLYSLSGAKQHLKRTAALLR